VTIPERLSGPERLWPACARHLFLSVLFALLVSVAAFPTAPQKSKPEKPYALIYGTVYGPDNRPVYGVKVHIRPSDEKKPKWEHYSDHQGEFAQRVPAGPATYVIWADLKGYKPLNGKKLQAGDPVTVNVQNDEREDVALHLK
jgi:hypothetical protein